MRHTPIAGRLLAGLLAAAPALATAGEAPARPSILGVWQELDDDTHRPQAEIEITARDGVFQGRIVKLFPAPGEPAAPVCSQCRGALKDKPILGFPVIENVRWNGSAYDGGTVTDPEDGSVYKVKLVPSTDGRTLSVTGYIGVSLFGRTEVWVRPN